MSWIYRIERRLVKLDRFVNRTKMSTLAERDTLVSSSGSLTHLTAALETNDAKVVDDEVGRVAGKH